MAMPEEVRAIQTVAKSLTKRRTQGKWYAVPGYSPSGNRSAGGSIVDSAGQHVASFEWIEDAEAVVKMMNGEEA